MVRYYVTFEVYGERQCLRNLEMFCKERELIFEYDDRFDKDSYEEYRNSCKTELGFEDAFRAWITFKNISKCEQEQILSQMNERDDINICIKIDM